MADEQRLLISDEALVEVKPKDERLVNWAKGLAGAVVISDQEIQEKVRYIVSKYKNLVPPNSDKSRADPFVIAVAMVKQAHVVSHESTTGNHNGPRIPDVCRHEGIPCIRIVNLLMLEVWKFR